MKRNISRVSLCALVCFAVIALIAAFPPKSSLPAKNPPELIRPIVDRIVFYNFEDLDESSDLVVVATVEGVNETDKVIYDNGRPFFAVSRYNLRVTKVLKGDAEAGQILPLTMEGGLVEETNQFITLSEIKPLEKGDQWIFFLVYDDSVPTSFSYHTYICHGDHTGIYPVPEDIIRSASRDKTLKQTIAKRESVTDKLKVALSKPNEDDLPTYDAPVNFAIYFDLLKKYAV